MVNHQWVNKQEYPFTSKFLEIEGIGRMHYIDEGTGDPIVMVHGNPTWSFSYRHLIKCLSASYRCVAVDHVGFGLSDKPKGWSYNPQGHAENFATLITALNLKNITLIVQDWGGPIGLSYAVNNPQNVKRIILMNTWMWPVKGDPHFERFSKFMGGALGRFLIKRFNFFVRVVMKMAYGDRTKFTKAIRLHYLKPLENPDDRKGCWVFPKQILAANDWLANLWTKVENIKTKPTLIMWGMKDIAFRAQELKKWEELFSNKDVIKFEEVGHFVQEEKGMELCPIITRFLEEHK